ncbi:DNA polymerase III subunit beta [Planosporangium mesophilum]|uniref:DNA polymerase III subunit beta n=1 Tax=Planosporangium mesophilum TaxID=689768 RepID=UPI0019501C7B|nr:DNA polymerase III subunit beta [Planosporangium mesophilum]
MTRIVDVTAPTEPLAEAAARMSRLLPVRSARPTHAGVLLRADDNGLLLVSSDGELTVRLRVVATTHEPGEIVVSRRGLTDTMAALDAPEVRLTAEGPRLAVRMPGARFALPRVGDAYPAPTRLPTAVGAISGAELRAAAVPVAGAASREHALPIFTGVRLRSHDGHVSLLATGRYRLASASVCWQPAGTGAVDALVPATVFAEAAKQAGRADMVVVHADGDLFGLAWDGGSVVTSTLGAPFPDAQLDRLLDVVPECAIDVGADVLAGAVDRASRYAGAPGRVEVEAIDGALRVRASDVLSGESEETVKAAVRGDHVTRFYQPRLLSDALRAFSGHTVQLRVQAGMRATEFTAGAGAAPAVHLRYLVVPMRPASSSDEG